MEGVGRRPRVCITGAGGFAASWLVKLLLSKGYLVHGTVRDPSDEKKYGHLKSLENATENLKLFKADLLDYDSIASAVVGSDGVFHVASPVPASNFSNQELSKTVAEKEAIDFASKNALDVITICPTVMFGPMLQSTINSSNWVIINLLRGAHKLVDRYTRNTLDVRDFADALLLVYENKEASGRYIASSDCVTTCELIDLLKRLFPNYSYPENITEPKKGNKLSSEKLRLLGWRHRPLEETLKDTVNYYRDAHLLD